MFNLNSVVFILIIVSVMYQIFQDTVKANLDGIRLNQNRIKEMQD